MSADQLARLLFDHAKECDSPACDVCECGWTSSEPGVPDMDQRYCAHVAEAITTAGYSREPQPTADDQTEAECQPNREASR